MNDKKTAATNGLPFLKGGGEMGRLIAAHDWSSTVLGPVEGWTQNLRASLSMMLKSRFPMLIFWGPALITFYNDAFRPSLGGDGKHPGSLGQRGEESWAESWPVIGPMIYDIMAGGEAVWFEDQKLPIYREGKMDYAYWTYSFSPLEDGEGRVEGLLVTCAETTRAVEGLEKLSAANGGLAAALEANRALQESEHEAHLKVLESRQQLLTLFEQAPLGIALLEGRDMVITFSNERMLRIWGKTAAVLGRKVMDALPELEGQPFMELMQGVYDTGLPYHGNATLAKLERKGVLEDAYFDFVYTPVRNAAGLATGVMTLASEVTEQVLARNALVLREAQLAAAIDVAGLGTFNINLQSGTVHYPERVADWFGQPDGAPLEALFASVPPEDAARMQAAIAAACAPDADRQIDIEHFVVNPGTGRSRIIHSKARVFLDNKGVPAMLMGTGQDVTIQKDLQHALETEVQLRTRELAASNEELGESNEQLLRSNGELAQYAYVASHDLQEPLRKIRMFIDMLRPKLAPGPDAQRLAVKIDQSVGRMAMLIRDVLAYSRLLNTQDSFSRVDLNEILSNVLIDLELKIGETGASLEMDSLPTIKAVASQMNQLFYNLLSNALKFTKPGRKPFIRISSQLLPEEAVARYIRRPLPGAGYHRICVSDNGIGFAPEYAEQIFEVFKRLHSREDYAGSGIGLALCRRIAGNHKGALLTESAPGEGATFILVLPDRH